MYIFLWRSKDSKKHVEGNAETKCALQKWTTCPAAHSLLDAFIGLTCRALHGRAKFTVVFVSLKLVSYGFVLLLEKPRSFHHNYIYYDPRKERLREMEDNAKRELGILPPKEFKTGKHSWEVRGRDGVSQEEKDAQDETAS
jgi:hypothetical protein